MKLFQVLGLVVLSSFIRYLIKVLLSGYYYSSLGVALASIVSLGIVILIGGRISGAKNINELNEPLDLPFTKKSIVTLILLFSVCLCIAEFERIFRLGTIVYFSRPFLFSWDEEMRKYFLNILIVAPIMEELFVRGVLFQILLRRYNRIISIAVTTLLFVLLHLDKNIFTMNFIVTNKLAIALSSIFYTVVLLKSRNIKLVIFLHFLWNMLLYLVPILLSLIPIDFTRPTVFFIFFGALLLITLPLLIRSLKDWGISDIN